MVMRLVMIFVLLMALTGCMEKSASESVSVEPAASEEVNDITTAPAQESYTAVEEDISAETAVETPSLETPTVMDIQQALKNANFYEGKLDGISGPKTKKAIEDFQAQNSLKVDGKVGPKTWQKLKEYLVQKAQ